MANLEPASHKEILEACSEPDPSTKVTNVANFHILLARINFVIFYAIVMGVTYPLRRILHRLSFIFTHLL